MLLVKTGDDDHSLSAPISFQPLFESGQVVPLDCGDHPGEGYNPEHMVRVRLDHALAFVEGLIRREEKALPHLQEGRESLQNELNELCDGWINRVLEHASSVGWDKNGFTWMAMGRARARVNGEAFDGNQIAPSWDDISMW